MVSYQRGINTVVELQWGVSVTNGATPPSFISGSWDEFTVKDRDQTKNNIQFGINFTQLWVIRLFVFSVSALSALPDQDRQGRTGSTGREGKSTTPNLFVFGYQY